MTQLTRTKNSNGPSMPILAMCWVKAFYMSVKHRFALLRIFYSTRELNAK